jgi:ubiquinone/menaquinone biosynthesis C-methylase UbiE
MTLNTKGWENYSIWNHSSTITNLYRRRCRLEEVEMTAHAQAAEILQSIANDNDSILDVGCGSGYFYHSIVNRKLPLKYNGIDAESSLIKIGIEELATYGLDPSQLSVLRIEDLDGAFDHVICLNVLSNIDNYHRPLERLLKVAKKSVILRESINDVSSYQYVVDEFLDPGYKLKVHVNTYQRQEILDFISSYGFDTKEIIDIRTNGEPEMVIGYPHHWSFIVATKRS